MDKNKASTSVPQKETKVQPSSTNEPAQGQQPTAGSQPKTTANPDAGVKAEGNPPKDIKPKVNGVPIDEIKAAVGPHAAPVVMITDDHKYALIESELEYVLMRQDIQDLPIAVVSVAGVYRAGKSFLLNFFLRYLNSPVSERVDGSWLSVDSKPLEGFSWRGGGERNTTGILFWSEPFVTTLPSGEKVAILLMDTQGTFDSSSTIRDCSTVFALSILLSSVQIYNLFYNINESDLQNLQFFTEYGRAVEKDGGKPFQTLEFLVRDWQYPYEHPYGATGGQDLLTKRLEVKPDQPKELRELREHIHNLFDNVSCFLMPHPGFAVMEPDFKGAINEIHPKFITQLKALVSSLFSPEKLLLKKINGEVVNAREYVTYFKSYMKIFNSDKVPPAATLFETTIKASLLAATNEARRLYETSMENDCGVKKPSVPLAQVKALHAKNLAAAQAVFSAKKKMGSKELTAEYLKKLTENLESRLKDYEAINLSKIQKAVADAKKAYKLFIAKIHGSKRLCVHAVDLDKIHRDAVNEAMKIFDTARPRISGVKDDERTAFMMSFEDELQENRLENEQNNKYAVMVCRSAYSDFMQKKCLSDPPLSSVEFKAQHDIALKKALEDFKALRNMPDIYTDDVYKSNLVTSINESYANLKLMNKAKNKVQINKAIEIYNDFMNLTWHIGQCLHPEDLIQEHKTAKCRALVAFNPSKLCYQGYDMNDEEERLLSQILEGRYQELESINETANNAAMSEGFKEFKSHVENRTKFSWWWLLVIPMIQTAVEIPKYVQEAREAGRKAFLARRRPGGLYLSDPYLEKLDKMMTR